MADVTKTDAGHDYTCPDCGFASTGWPSRAVATARGQQHTDEHLTREPMPELDDFRRTFHLRVDADGKVR